MSERPLAIDLFTGLHGWAEGLIAQGWRVIGFDLEDMCAQFGEARPEHVSLVIQDVLTLHGSQFKDADLIVASPPCQEYSYMAMPWSLAKAKGARIRADETGAELERLNRLFNACFRIQREASEAAGRYIPMVVENVRGAQPWVGPAAWSYGSYYLWGDVPALMPNVVNARKVPGFRFDGSGRSFQTASVVASSREQAAIGQEYVTPAEGRKHHGDWFRDPSCPSRQGGQSKPKPAEGRKGAGAGAEWFDQNLCQLSSKSSSRKAASAKIAKIPFALSSHIARVYRP